MNYDPSAANLAHMRQDYKQASLDLADVHPNPYVQFGQWFQQAVQAGAYEPNAMHLATASAEGRPSGRLVLLKDFNAQGFTFYTNYESRKGRQLHENPHAALTFFWPELERQVRIEGMIAPVSTAESDAYFAQRPRESQLGAHASAQSREIASRAALEARLAAVTSQFGHNDQPIPRPAHWGGYRLVPVLFEYWQGRASRLHDRIVYELQDDGSWRTARLMP